MIQTAAHRFLSFFFPLLVLLASGPVHAQDASTPRQSYTVRGTVINSVTHEPIARALVTLPGETSNAMLTDSEGRFEFANVPAGRCILQARRPGFFSEGPQREVFQAINVGPKSEDVVLDLEPAASITGQVILSTSDPASNIHVQLMRRIVQEGRGRWQPTEMKSTNSDGIFRFGNLQPGEYKLYTASSIEPNADQQQQTPMRWGFPSVWYPDPDDSSTTGVLKLSAGQQVNAALTLDREPFYSVTVSSTNKTDGVNFQLRDRTGRQFESPLSYDPQRQLIHTYLPNGSYTLIGQYYGPTIGFGSTQITVHNASVGGQSLTILPVHPIPVVIRKEFSTPDSTDRQMIMIAGGSQMEVSRDVNLMLFSAKDNDTVGGNLQRAPGSAGDSGWTLNNVFPGTYWVQTYASQGYVASITAGGTDLTHEPLVIGPGGTSPPMEIVLRNDTASLSVRLKNSTAVSDDQSPGAFLYLLPQFDLSSVVPESEPLNQTARELANLQPGTYRVLALDHPLDFEYRNPKAIEPYLGKGQTVTLGPGGTTHVDLDIIPAEPAAQ